MPSHKIHRYVSRALLGKSFSKIHQALDWPYKILGRKHRCMFHTYPEAFLIGTLTSSDPYAAAAACLHILTDDLCSENKNLKMVLELLAKQDATRRRQMHKWKKLTKQ